MEDPQTPEHLERLYSRILTVEQLLKQQTAWRLKSETIVFTNGCFDILHRGHVEYLNAAATFGRRLVIGLNSDKSVKGLGKGPDRPLNDELSRALILAALRVTDAVVLFDENTPVNILEQLRPDVYVKGADYQIEDLPEAPVVQKWGGVVKTVALTEGFSTTGFISKIAGN